MSIRNKRAEPPYIQSNFEQQGLTRHDKMFAVYVVHCSRKEKSSGPRILYHSIENHRSSSGYQRNYPKLGIWNPEVTGFDTVFWEGNVNWLVDKEVHFLVFFRYCRPNVSKNELPAWNPTQKSVFYVRLSARYLSHSHDRCSFSPFRMLLIISSILLSRASDYYLRRFARRLSRWVSFSSSFMEVALFLPMHC